MVIIPIALGFLITHFFGKYTSKMKDVLPLISVISIALIIASIVSHNSERIMNTGAIVFIVVILHNLLGFAAGFLLGHLLKLPLSKKKTLAIEVGMQNSGLASSLAGTAFPGLAMATVPGAIFSVWHNISGAILASVFIRMKGDTPEKKGQIQKNVEGNRTLLRFFVDTLSLKHCFGFYGFTQYPFASKE